MRPNTTLRAESAAKAVAALCLAGTLFTASGARAQPAPEPPGLTFVFEETVTLDADMKPWKTGMGERNIMTITGGTFEGPGNGAGIKGTIISGGWDWQLTRADGCTVINANYMLKTDDGAIINIVNQGPVCPPETGKPFAPMRTVPVFEPPLGKYQWLAQSSFISTIDPIASASGPAVRIRFYRVN